MVYPFLDPVEFSSEYKCFLAKVDKIDDPLSYSEAKGKLHWEKDNHTWELVKLPLGKSAIGSKWVFKTKLHPDGSIDKYKARLVAKGYNQVEGEDYIDSFSPVAKTVAVRIVLALASAKQWVLRQIDINNAFLHGFIDEELVWFYKSIHDNCLFVYHGGAEFVVVLVYVDDMLLTGTSEQVITRLKTFLNRKFTIKNLGPARYFLGLEIARSSAGTYVNQRKYTLDLISEVGLMGAKPVTTPIPKGLKLSSESGELLEDVSKYQRVVGRLLYLEFTRPDITYVVHQLSQYVHAPRTVHWNCAMYVLKYLKGCPSLGLFYPVSTGFQPVVYNDADWAASEAEYRSMADAVTELMWISFILRDLAVHFQLPVSLHCDNKAALYIAANPVFH
ncbi:hypothetical protein K2173_008208 [Erythroxylum novogranatense]|uniref:Reverse transcriptase Ty1/copia-type domain-containing protein n=1 Tax=Erythroxylum novogranatense TaxID=1862640 RepID=A0AAV8UA23_9ROSI|nr:hypothetical protein K2173_008208 [Erythroxylum novogranatense]